MTTTVNTLLGGRLQIIQPVAGYRVAVDPVLLAAATPARAGQRILDLGCGTAAASLCLLTRVSNLFIVGVERNSEHASLARQTLELNRFSDRACIIEGDILCLKDYVDALGRIDGVMLNPPYFVEGNLSSCRGKAEANHESDAALRDWIRSAHTVLKPKGHLTVIQAADRLQDILVALADGFGAIEVIPLWPKPARDAKRILVRAIKGRKTPLRFRAGLCLHQDDGSYTSEADALLRDGVSFDDILKTLEGDSRC